MQKFDDNKDVRVYKNSVIFKRLFVYMKPVLPWFIVAVVLSAFITVSELVPAFLQGQLIGILSLDITSTDPDYLRTYGDLIKNATDVMARLDITIGQFKILVSSFYVGIFIIILIVATIFNYLSRVMLQKAGQRIVLDLRRDTFTHIENLSIAQINKTPVGKLVTRVTGDMNAINDMYANVMINLLKSILSIIFVVIVLFLTSPILALYLSIVAPILLVVSFIFNKVSRNQYRKVRGCFSNVNAFLSENLSGMKITQIFNQEDKKLNEFNEKNEDLKKNQLKDILIFAIFRPCIYVIYIVSQIIVLYNGFNLVRGYKLTVQKYVSFYSYIGNLFNPIQALADQFNQLQLAFASAERVLSTIDTPIDILDSDNAIELEEFKGKIEFDHVWFAYNEGEWILKDVSFTVMPKETCAFVGATGAGKTTILGLIVRNYEIQKGEIRIDDIPIKNIKIESLRRHIGQMLQDVFLFSGSIRNNITLRDPDFTDDEVYEAAKYVNADRLINKLDGKLDYQVLERGSNFSSGERQLLSFARTIIHKPNIMILDEATANIDTETELLIQDSLERMKNVGTMLIVAHRLSTIQHADKIIVLHKGQIMEEGNHQELLKKKGLYYNLYEIQYKN